MSTHSDVEETFISHLKSRDFSEASILREPEFETAYGSIVARPDLVVVDPGSTEPLAIFEVKSQLDARKQHKYLLQIGSYSDLFPSAPTYLVTSGSGELGFQIYLFDRKSRSFTSIRAEALPSHADLVEAYGASKAAEVVERKSSRKRASTQLRWICWSLAAVCGALGVADFVWDSKEILNSSRLAVLGVVVGLVILPFAQRLKLLGFEYERVRVRPSKETSGA